jgi:hypothetical protein
LALVLPELDLLELDFEPELELLFFVPLELADFVGMGTLPSEGLQRLSCNCRSGQPELLFAAALALASTAATTAALAATTAASPSAFFTAFLCNPSRVSAC